MTVQFQMVTGTQSSSATIFIEGHPEPFNYNSSQPHWEQVVKILTDSILNPPADVEELLTLVSPVRGLEIKFKRLSDRFVFRKGKVYLDGVEAEGAVIDHLAKIVTAPESKPEDYDYLLKFLEKLYTNPSATSIDHLYHFLNSHGMVITDDGDLIAYKGVLANYGSITAGPGIVNGEEFEDKVHLDNSIGNVVEMPRAKVDDNRQVACSVGLHAGSYTYADRFRRGSGGHLLHVKINPRDVVSVPQDEGNAKIRVSRYVVVGEGDDEIKTPTYPATFEVPETEPEVTPEEPEATPEPEPEEEEVEPTEFSPEERAAAKAAPAQAEVDPNSHEGRVARMRVVILTLPKGTNLKRYRNKNVTAKNRLPFDEALKQIEDEA